MPIHHQKTQSLREKILQVKAHHGKVAFLSKELKEEILKFADNSPSQNQAAKALGLTQGTLSR